MSDIVQRLEDLIEQLSEFQKSVNKLKTASVSGTTLRQRARELHKLWLPIAGQLEQDGLGERAEIDRATEDWKRLRKLADAKSPKASYKATIKELLQKLEESILHPLIKRSGLRTVGGTIRALLVTVTDPDLTKYLDESVRCAEQNCVRGSVVLAWCAVASRVHRKLASLGMPQLESEFDKMRLDNGLLFKAFNRVYKFSSPADIQEIPDAHLLLLCRYLTWLDDSQYKQLKVALDLRNACGHPTGYQPDAIKLQAYYSDLMQLVFSNPKIA